MLPTAAAQEAGVLMIGTPDTSAFPVVRFQMDAYDEQGEFIDDLKFGEVKILEDGKTVRPQRVDKINTGLQVVVALNTAPGMGVENNGTTEHQRVQAALVDWASGQMEQSLDDFSFSTPTGLVLVRERDSGKLANAIAEYQPDLSRSAPSLTSLAEALDLATDPAGRPGIKRAILYVTPPLPADQRETLPDLSDRAQQIGVQVNVWMVGEDPIAPNPLASLAESTGGRFYSILPASPLPLVEPMFHSLRQSYEVVYESTVQKSGEHQLSVIVGNTGTVLESNEQRFSLEVLPPNPIFLSPPASIERTWTTPTANNTVPALMPESVELQIVLEFPDRHTREVKASRLYVDDQVVDENTSEPFDRFRWPVGEVTTTGRYLLRVEVVDSIGLIGSSIAVPVDVVVDAPAKTSIANGISTRGIITVAAIAVSGIALAVVLTVTGNQRWRRKGQSNDKKRMKDPVTQPVKIYQEPVSRPRKTGPANGKPAKSDKPSQPTNGKPVTARASSVWPMHGWPRQQSQATAPARLIALDENEQPVTGGAVSLARQEITFGSDPRRATQVIESATIDALHARLFRSPDGTDFFLADNESVAGTWVNYTPIDSSGVRLEHGDLIHIGRSMFRFELTDASRCQPAVVKVVRLEQEL